MSDNLMKQFAKAPQEMTQTYALYPQLDSSMDYPKPKAISLLQALASQNKEIVTQQSILNQQLNKLTYLSDYLLTQNSDLRHLYQQRSLDIQQTISTMKINLDLEYSQNQQLQHLVKSSNCMLIRQIKKNSQFQEQLQTNVQKLQQQHIKLNKQKSQAELQVLNKIKVNLKDRLNQDNIHNLQKQQQKVSNEHNQIAQDVNNLVLQVSSYLGGNIGIGDKIGKLKIDNSVNTHMCSQEIVKVLNNRKFLQGQKDQLKAQANMQEQINQQIQSNYTSNQHKMYEVSSKKDQLNLQIDKVSYQYANLQHILSQYRKKLNKAQNNHQNVKEQLQQRNAENTKIAQRIKQMKKMHKNNIEQNQKQFRNIIWETKKKCKQVQIQFEQQIKVLRAQRRITQSQIDQRQADYNMMDEEITQKTRIIQALQNPIADIERLQLMLRIDSERQPLVEIVSVN